MTNENVNCSLLITIYGPGLVLFKKIPESHLFKPHKCSQVLDSSNYSVVGSFAVGLFHFMKICDSSWQWTVPHSSLRVQTQMSPCPPVLWARTAEGLSDCALSVL